MVCSGLCAGRQRYRGGATPPHRRRPTGIKRAASRVAWPDVFRRIPSSFAVTLNENADRNDRLAAVGSLCVLIAVLAWCIAVLALITAFVSPPLAQHFPGAGSQITGPAG